jgi:hypothetical protein
MFVVFPLSPSLSLPLPPSPSRSLSLPLVFPSLPLSFTLSFHTHTHTYTYIHTRMHTHTHAHARTRTHAALLLPGLLGGKYSVSKVTGATHYMLCTFLCDEFSLCCVFFYCVCRHSDLDTYPLLSPLCRQSEMQLASVATVVVAAPLAFIYGKGDAHIDT